MAAPIAVQLYTLRDAMAQDFAGVVRKLADIGYVGVETAGFNGSSPEEAARLFKDLGLSVTSMHSGDVMDEGKRSSVVDLAGLMGTKRVVVPWQDPKNFESDDAIKAVAERLNAADAFVRQHGLELHYHNHWFEYGQVNGKPTSDILLSHLAPTVGLEIDTYWVKTGGADPAALIRQVGRRAPLLHIKDGPTVRDQPMTAVGDGKMDWPPLFEAAKDSAEWLIVELDQCATDMLEAVTKSYHYLVGKGYARGNKS
jgi:sugar phosphate isomerase/epimerase